MEPAPALQHLLLKGLSNAPPGLGPLVSNGAGHPPLSLDPHVHNSMMPFLPQVQASIPQVFPHPQVTAPLMDPRDVHVSAVPDFLLSKSGNTEYHLPSACLDDGRSAASNGRQRSTAGW